MLLNFLNIYDRETDVGTTRRAIQEAIQIAIFEIKPDDNAEMIVRRALERIPASIREYLFTADGWLENILLADEKFTELSSKIGEDY